MPCQIPVQAETDRRNAMEKRTLSDENLIKLMEFQWQDHFQTRTQTWRALEIAALIAIALVGLDWKIDTPIATYFSAGLLFLVAQFGTLITLRHRNSVEITKFRMIREIGVELGTNDSSLPLPEKINWYHIFSLSKSNTSLFLLRMHFILQVFSGGMIINRLLET
jgi:hypothetical protein